MDTKPDAKFLQGMLNDIDRLIARLEKGLKVAHDIKHELQTEYELSTRATKTIADPEVAAAKNSPKRPITAPQFQPPKKKLTRPDAAAAILVANGGPMKTRDIVDEMFKSGVLKIARSVQNKRRIVNSLYSAMLKQEDRFEMVEMGTWDLHDRAWEEAKLRRIETEADAH